MGPLTKHFVVPICLLMLLAKSEATPPGIAKNPSHATCNIKKYKYCYNLVHVCPKFCPDSCTVECASCKPICGAGSPVVYSPPESSPSPPESESPPPKSPPESESPPPKSPSPPESESPPKTRPSPPPEAESPPPKSPSPPPEAESPPPKSPSPPESESPPQKSPSPPPATESPPPQSPSPPESESPTPPTFPSPPPSYTPPPSPTPATSTPSSPSPPTPSPHTPSPSPPPSSPPSPKTGKCKNKSYSQCYDTEHVCPSACPGGCEVDCVTCKPVCKCDRPGAVCQDPRFIGGDGITFYFHGKRDRDFCLVSDQNIHINAHFIGKRNENMTRDFTWVQSIGVLFGKHQLFLGALKTSTWHDSVDRLALAFDGEPLIIPEKDGANWQSPNVPSVSITRVSDTNNVVVDVEGRFKITAKVVPITAEDSKIHNYGITQEDCFAHLDLGFKFYTLSDEVNGVLGQTYRPYYVSRLNIGAKMPVMEGSKDFETSSLFAADCAVARFGQGNGFDGEDVKEGFELPSLKCASGIDGQGVACKR